MSYLKRLAALSRVESEEVSGTVPCGERASRSMALSCVERESKEVSGTVSCGEGARSVDIAPTQKGAENCEGG